MGGLHIVIDRGRDFAGRDFLAKYPGPGPGLAEIAGAGVYLFIF